MTVNDNSERPVIDASQGCMAEHRIDLLVRSLGDITNLIIGSTNASMACDDAGYDPDRVVMENHVDSLVLVSKALATRIIMVASGDLPATAVH
ncbi:MAG: hypothetical protein KDG54_11190 [Geminicoccaceae bacterium]|nr:hypothetical protein [Geminicoccaceae bacterium]